MTTVADPARLPAVMEFVRTAAGQPDNPTLDLLVEEAFLNIAMHACPGEAVEVACAGPASGEVTVEFRYPGPEFDPRSSAPDADLDASLAERQIGGLGVFLMLQMAAGVQYRREGGMNHLSLAIAVAATGNGNNSQRD